MATIHRSLLGQWVGQSLVVVVLFLAICLLEVHAKARGGGSASSSDVTDPPSDDDDCPYYKGEPQAPPVYYKEFDYTDYTWVHILLWTLGLGLVAGILIALALIQFCLYYRSKKTAQLREQSMLRKLVPTETRY